jgi:beta-lactam-binding protein with PASTA domain
VRPEDQEQWDDAETRVMPREPAEPAEPPPPGPPPPVRPWWRENWWIWLALVGVLAIAGVLLAIFAGGDDEEPAATTTAELVAVPDVVGLSEDQAIGRIEGAGLEAEAQRERADQPEGTVLGQDPAAGTGVEPGTAVTIRVAEPEPTSETVTVTETTPTEPPPPPAPVAIPDVLGLDHVDAGAQIDQGGLVANTYPVDSSEPQGVVVAQNPAAGTELPEGEAVRLNVSLASDPRADVTVPDLTGPAAADARAACREAGLTCRTLYRAAPGQEEIGEVLDQRPAAGSVVPALTQVTLFVGS